MRELLANTQLTNADILDWFNDEGLEQGQIDSEDESESEDENDENNHIEPNVTHNECYSALHVCMKWASEYGTNGDHRF